MPKYRSAVALVGRLGRDPELKVSTRGTPYLSFSVATTSGKDDKAKTDWHNCTAFGGIAERIADEFAKGSWIAVWGRLTYDQYEKDGVKRTAVKILVDDAAEPEQETREHPDGTAATIQRRPARRQAVAVPATEADFDDDIPF